MPKPADILLTHGRVFTVDPANPQAEAVAVNGRRIVFVGSAADAAAWRGPQTRVIDALGRTLLPGFIDSHFHLLLGSIELGDIQLAEAAHLDDMRAAVTAYAAGHPDQEWLVGRGLAYYVLPAGPLPPRLHLDRIEPDRPLIVFAYDAHTAWANTAALRRAGILEQGEARAANSEIVRGSDGLATGELREPGAYEQVMDLVPPPDEARRRTLLHQGLAQAAAVGITSIHNMDGNAEQLGLYAALEDLGELTLRVYCPYSVTPETPLEALAEAAELARAYRSDMVRGGCVKFFMDGVIESYTGLLVDGYEGQPDNLGGANYSPEHFTRMATEADRLGLQIFVHAVGDGAVRRTLDGYEAARNANGRRDSRHRIEHVELVHPDDLPRFAELGVIASMQPRHAPLDIADPDVWPIRVGQRRWQYSFAWQTLRQAGARLAFGSDWPVAVQNPLVGLHYALNRQPWAAGLPDQRQSLADAIAAYTRDAAYAEFQEQAKGQIRSGMLADMVLLSEDINAVPPDAIEQVRPVLTMCNGTVVYEA